MSQNRWAYTRSLPPLNSYHQATPVSPVLLSTLLLGSLVVLAAIILRAWQTGSMQGIGLLALRRAQKGFKTESSTLHDGSLVAANGTSQVGDQHDVDHGVKDLTYPGLLNTSTTCYLNSTLQSLASCPSVVEYLHSLVDSSEAHLELTNALLQMLQALNSPRKNGVILNTSGVLHSLLNSSSSSNASKNRRRIMQGSGQQDAQEFFLILAETVEEEKKVLFDKLAEKKEDKVGFEELLMPQELLQTLYTFGSDDALRNPFEASMAHRTSCLACGYAEAIRHLPTENLTLNVPSARVCPLENMLGDYTKLELIDEYGCRRCSMIATRNRLKDQLDALKGPEGSESRSQSKKKRIREQQRILAHLDEIVEAADFEIETSDLPVKLDRAIGPASKQVMFSVPPRLLVLHLSRSSFFEGSFGYSQKNNCIVQFPEYLDMTPFTTTSSLKMKPNQPLSSGQLRDDGTGNSMKYIYSLAAVVVHVGNHYSGHYLTFRRRPRTKKAGSLAKHWFRISDEDVELASLNEVLSSNPFLLFYESCNETAPPADKPAFSFDGMESWRLLNLAAD